MECHGIRESSTASPRHHDLAARRLDGGPEANYYRDAENLAEYRSHGHFLPYINNEALER